MAHAHHHHHPVGVPIIAPGVVPPAPPPPPEYGIGMAVQHEYGSGTLPFTGFAALEVLALAVVIIAAGLLLRLSEHR